jgi:hypothetical protein
MFALAITVLTTANISEPLLLATCITAQLKCVLSKHLHSFSSPLSCLNTLTLMQIAQSLPAKRKFKTSQLSQYSD